MHLVTKLMVALVGIVVAIAIISGVSIYKSEEAQLLNVVTMGADQLSGSISSSIWHLMLADRRDDAYQVMETIAVKQGIDRLSMFNRGGEVTFSTNHADRGRREDPTSERCRGCHDQRRKLEKLSLRDRVRMRETALGQRRLSVITPIPNERQCSSGECHAHPKEQRVLGLLEVSLNLDVVDAELASMQQRIAWRAIAEIGLICPLIFFFARRFIRRPIEQLIEGANAISRMDLDKPVPIPAHAGEITELAASFDLMRVRLRDAVAEINQFTHKLEGKVAERTKELKVAHQKLLQSDRLASLGQLSASVAHEINNPVAGVLNMAMLMQRILKDDGIPPERVADFRRYLTQVAQETSRVGRIVSDLLAFSRRPSPHRAETDVNAVIRNTVSLAGHKLKLASIEPKLELAEDLPPVLCDRSQLQQVILNLVLNAAESMQAKKGGELVVATGRADGHSVWLRVADQGEGIPAEVLPRIFDPFFTTKAEGKGVGLGLAVTYGIIQAHGGDIEVMSEPGSGTTFVVTLPLHPPEEKALGA